MHMRKSRTLKKLRDGKAASCIKINLTCPRVAELAAMMGFDCLWLDMEHIPNDWMILEHQIRAAKIYDVDVVVRVERGSYSDYIKPLEIDASGIMVPHIMNLKEARDLVRKTRFHPLGRRPLDGGNADGGFCQVPLADYIRQANDQRFVIVQIEDPEPLAELEQIAALEGIDMLFFGPGDFSHSIGAPGDFAHPKLRQARRQIAEICNNYGKIAGTVGCKSNLQELFDIGYRFISYGADVIGLQHYFADIVKDFKDLEVG